MRHKAGRRGPAPRRLVEECLVLDAAQVTPERRVPGAEWWSTISGKLVPDAMTAQLLVRRPAPDQLVLTVFGWRGQYQLWQSIDLTFLDLPWGGQRASFRCPGINDAPCGRRVHKLFWPVADPRRFGCRRCHDLAYASTRKEPVARRWARLNRIATDLAAEAGLPTSALVGPGLRAMFARNLTERRAR